MMVLILLVSGNYMNAQSTNDSTDKPFISTLVDFSYVNFDLDFFKFSSDEYIISHLGNGTLKLDKNDYLSMEYTISHVWMNNSSYITPGDFSFFYKHNFYSKKYLNSGFQGVATKFKFVLPTGKSELLSGLDNWVFEPSLYYGWLLKNKRFFVTNHLRYHFSIGHLPNTTRSKPYIRYEASFGYESNKFWVAATVDNRMYMDSYIILLKSKIGYKLHKKASLYTAYTAQVYGKQIYEYYFNMGYFVIF